MQKLFRDEALHAMRDEWLGSIVVAVPLSRWMLALLAATAACSIILLFTLGHYTRRESVSGQLVPVTGLITLTSIGNGSVTRVWVHDGQFVKQGDPLVEISSAQDSVALGDTAAFVARALSDQRARLKSDLSVQAAVTTQQADLLRDKIRSLGDQMAQAESQLQIEREQEHAQQALLERIRPLAEKGYVSALQMQQQKSLVLDAAERIKTLTRQWLDLQQQLASARQQLAQLPLDATTRRNDTERQLAALGQVEAQNEMQRATLLNAPCAGVISTVLSKPGQMISAAQPVASLVPEGSLLQAQLLVPSRAIGFIEQGSRVVLRYQAFPYQKFGQQYGRVADISRSALSPSELETLVGQKPASNEPLYRVQVALDHQSVLAYGKAEPLKPGMAVDADVLMERRRLIEWVFEPLYGFGHRFLADAEHG